MKKKTCETCKYYKTKKTDKLYPNCSGGAATLNGVVQCLAYEPCTS